MVEKFYDAGGLKIKKSKNHFPSTIPDIERAKETYFDPITC